MHLATICQSELVLREEIGIGNVPDADSGKIQFNHPAACSGSGNSTCLTKPDDCVCHYCSSPHATALCRQPAVGEYHLEAGTETRTGAPKWP